MAKKRSSSAARAAKKLHPATVVLAAVFLAVGIGAGVFASEALSAGDSFTLNGGREVHLSLGEAFDDPGATVLSFGRDISDRVQVGGGKRIRPKSKQTFRKKKDQREGSAPLQSLSDKVFPRKPL